MNTLNTNSEASIQYFDICVFLYLGSWLAYLTKKHYREVTTRAGHIFELHVLLNQTIDIFFWFFLDSGALADADVAELCTLNETLITAFTINIYVGVAGSQIETAIFLRTKSLHVISTNTAGFICLGMSVFSLVMASLLTLLTPGARQCRRITSSCDYFVPWDFYRTILPASVSLTIVVIVLGITLYSSHQFNWSQQIGTEVDNLDHDMHNAPIFENEPVFKKVKHKRNENAVNISNIRKNDLVIEDIEDAANVATKVDKTRMPCCPSQVFTIESMLQEIGDEFEEEGEKRYVPIRLCSCGNDLPGSPWSVHFSLQVEIFF